MYVFSFDEIVPGSYVLLEIKETGSGMDEATKAKIVDPFFTTKFTGRGLGLAAALSIVKTYTGQSVSIARPVTERHFTSCFLRLR